MPSTTASTAMRLQPPRGDPAGRQSGDADPADRTRSQSRFDRRPGVISVDVYGIPSGGSLRSPPKSPRICRQDMTVHRPADPSVQQKHHLELGRGEGARPSVVAGCAAGG